MEDKSETQGRYIRNSRKIHQKLKVDTPGTHGRPETQRRPETKGRYTRK